MDLISHIQRQLGYLFASYSAMAGSIWITRAGWTPLALTALGGHLLLAGLLLLWVRRLGRAQEPTDFGRRRLATAMLWPWLLWLMSWAEIGWLFRIAVPDFHDQAIAQLDLSVFGAHWNELLPRIWAGPGWHEIMTGFYLSYYFLILGPPVVLALKRRQEAFMGHTLGLMLSYLGCFTIYLLWPVAGPREMAVAAGAPATEAALGFLPGLMNAVFAAGDSVGTAFPSSHCAGATAAALLCHRYFSVRVAVTCGLWAGLIVISTIHTNNHYAIDALAGIALAGLFCFKGVRHESHTRHRSHGLHRATSCAAAHPAGTPTASSGAKPRQGDAPLQDRIGLRGR